MAPMQRYHHSYFPQPSRGNSDDNVLPALKRYLCDAFFLDELYSSTGTTTVSKWALAPLNFLRQSRAKEANRTLFMVLERFASSKTINGIRFSSFVNGAGFSLLQ